MVKFWWECNGMLCGDWLDQASQGFASPGTSELAMVKSNSALVVDSRYCERYLNRGLVFAEMELRRNAMEEVPRPSLGSSGRYRILLRQ